MDAGAANQYQLIVVRAYRNVALISKLQVLHKS